MAVPGTPESIETTRTVEYRLAVDYQLNETPGKLKPLASQASYQDKSAQIVDRFDDLQIREIVERNGDTVNTDIDVERRWIHKPRRQMVAPLLDRDDMMATKLDLKSPLAKQTAVAVRRAQDDRWLQGYFGLAYTGESGTVAVPFKPANIMAADYGETPGTNVGITLNKLITMQEMLRVNMVDTESEMPIMIITAKQVSDLLKINQLQNRDYNPLLQQALQTGRPGDFMGFTFVMAEIGNPRAYPNGSSLTLASAGIRRNPVFVKSGMHFGTWEEFMGRITERDDKNFSWQIYGETVGAAARVNEDKVYQMLNKEV